MPATGRRVVVTGLGVVAPCGIGRDAYWQGLLAPAPEGDRLVHDFDPTPWLGPKEARRTDRVLLSEWQVYRLLDVPRGAWTAFQFLVRERLREEGVEVLPDGTLRGS